jgi:hypothetical protein
MSSPLNNFHWHWSELVLSSIFGNVQQMQKKDLNMKRRKDLNGFSTQNGAKVVPG